MNELIANIKASFLQPAKCFGGPQDYGPGCIGAELLLSAQWEERRTILGWKCTFCFWLSHYWTSSYSKDLLGETVTAMSLLHEHLIFALKPWNLKDLFHLKNCGNKKCLRMKSKISKVANEGLMTLTGSSNPLYATSAQARFWEGKRAFFGGWEKGWLRRKGHKRNHKVRLFVGESEKKWGHDFLPFFPIVFKTFQTSSAVN